MLKRIEYIFQPADTGVGYGRGFGNIYRDRYLIISDIRYKEAHLLKTNDIQKEINAYSKWYCRTNYIRIYYDE